MKIHVHPCLRRNVGDDLNHWFWRELLGEALDGRDDELLVGIGTVLNDMLPDARRLHILGSGAGYGTRAVQPAANWDLRFVRGPLTARTLGLAPEFALADPAILIDRLRPQDRESDPRPGVTAFMPHIGIDSPQYRALVEELGWRYISPSDDEGEVLHAIASSERLITSAMHGAILADSYRVPWLPVITSPEILQFKWQDWCASMEIEYRAELLPSYWGAPATTLKQRATRAYKRHRIVARLRAMARAGRFSLSQEAHLRQMQDRVAEKIEEFRISLGEEARNVGSA